MIVKRLSLGRKIDSMSVSIFLMAQKDSSATQLCAEIFPITYRSCDCK